MLTAVTFSLFGFIIGIWADGFEKLQLIPLLIVTPLTFLGGSFYSIDMLPPFWQTVTLFNPVVYLISGFRWSFYGVADVSVGVSLGMTLVFLAICLAIVWLDLQDRLPAEDLTRETGMSDRAARLGRSSVRPIAVETADAVVIAATMMMIPVRFGQAEHALDRTDGAADAGTDCSTNHAPDGAGHAVALVSALLGATDDTLRVTDARQRDCGKHDRSSHEDEQKRTRGRGGRGHNLGMSHLRSLNPAEAPGRAGSLNSGAAEWLRDHGHFESAAGLAKMSPRRSNLRLVRQTNV